MRLIWNDAQNIRSYEFNNKIPENDVVLVVLFVFQNKLLPIASTSCCLHLISQFYRETFKIIVYVNVYDICGSRTSSHTFSPVQEVVISLNINPKTVLQQRQKTWNTKNKMMRINSIGKCKINLLITLSNFFRISFDDRKIWYDKRELIYDVL